MHIWDGDPRAIPATLGSVLVWSGAAVRPGDRALADILEADADAVRQRYLAWVHELGDARIGGRALRTLFKLPGGASYWPQSLFYEQSAWRQPSLEPLLRVFALLGLIVREPQSALTYHGPDRELAQVLDALCRVRGIGFTDVRVAGAVPAQHWRRRLPQPVQALLAWGYLARNRWRVRGLPRDLPASDDAVLICGPLFNYETRAGEFYSRYWTSLPGMLRGAGRRLVWLHYLYMGDPAGPRESARRVQLWNAHAHPHASGGDAHRLLDSFATAATFVRIKLAWLRLAVTSLRAGAVLRARFRASPEESFWPLLRADWAKAFRGTGSVENLYYSACFRNALSGAARFRDGLYLMENQGWERSLACAWHAGGNGRLAGVAHSTVRFWDLRYHTDVRRYAGENPARPDVVVLNGAAARASYLGTMAEREPVVECEALRYLHFGKSTEPVARAADEVTRLLVVGDYVLARTRAMLQMTAEVRRALSARGRAVRVQLKAHPASPPGEQERALLDFEPVTDDVTTLAASADLVFVSNTTSAALDAYVGGATVVVHDGRESVNYSPLRGFAGVVFVSNAAELAAAVEGSTRERHEMHGTAAEFFALDPELGRWKRFFGVTAPEAA